MMPGNRHVCTVLTPAEWTFREIRGARLQNALFSTGKRAFNMSESLDELQDGEEKSG
jgi:hypothetical protein